MRLVLRAACRSAMAMGLAVALATVPLLAQSGRARAPEPIGPCPTGGVCPVESGEYRVHAPQGTSTKDRLPVVLYFHGYRESAAEILGRDDVRALADRHRALLVVPDGAGGTWSHPGSPASLRDEFRFVDQVMADLGRRYRVDTDRILVSGFSQGAAMVWNLLCHRGDRFTAFLPISGTFWTPQPAQCPTSTRKLIHIHGVSDRTVPLDGRPIRNGAFRQGDVFKALGMARRANNCPAEGARSRRRGALICDVATGCAGGADIELCLHPGGHDFDPSWLEIGLGQLGGPQPERQAQECRFSTSGKAC